MPPNKYNIYIFMIMRTGDKVLISPDLTHAKDWTQGEVIEVGLPVVEEYNGVAITFFINDLYSLKTNIY